MHPQTESDGQAPAAAYPPVCVMQLLEEAIAAKHSRDQAVSSLVHDSQRQLQRNQQEWKASETLLYSALEQAWDRLSLAAHADEISSAEGRALQQQLFGQPRRNRAHHDPRVDVLLKAAASTPQRPLLRRCCWELVRCVCQHHAHTELLGLLDDIEHHNRWWQRHNNDPNALLPTKISRQRFQQIEHLQVSFNKAVGPQLSQVAWPKGAFDEELIAELRSNQLERRREGRSQLIFGLFLCVLLFWALSLFV